MKKKIKSGTACFISETGHNNFYYPVANEMGLTKFNQDVEDYQLKSWICGNSNLKAVVVKADTLESIVCTPEAKTVVWLDTTKVKIL